VNTKKEKRHMMIALFIIAAFFLGAAGHAVVARKAAATEVEVADWAARLKIALAADEKTAAAKLRGLLKELEERF
jgi:hypothetical protein